MVVLQSLRKGPNHCWNFIKSGYESATSTFDIFVFFGLPDKAAQIKWRNKSIRSVYYALCVNAVIRDFVQIIKIKKIN